MANSLFGSSESVPAGPSGADCSVPPALSTRLVSCSSHSLRPHVSQRWSPSPTASLTRSLSQAPAQAPCNSCMWGAHGPHNGPTTGQPTARQAGQPAGMYTDRRALLQLSAHPRSLTSSASSWRSRRRCRPPPRKCWRPTPRAYLPARAPTAWKCHRWSPCAQSTSHSPRPPSPVRVGKRGERVRAKGEGEGEERCA